MRVQQKTIDFDGEKETIISVNGCNIAYAVFDRDLDNMGFKVVSFAGGDNGLRVASGRSWSDVRSKARVYAKEHYGRHVAYHVARTWAAKIKALKAAAAKSGNDKAIFEVDKLLARGVEHMKYKDFTEFDCTCKEQYIYQEAEVCIDRYNLSV